jgi:hypothetical protein
MLIVVELLFIARTIHLQRDASVNMSSQEAASSCEQGRGSIIQQNKQVGNTPNCPVLTHLHMSKLSIRLTILVAKQSHAI